MSLLMHAPLGRGNHWRTRVEGAVRSGVFAPGVVGYRLLY